MGRGRNRNPSATKRKRKIIEARLERERRKDDEARKIQGHKLSMTIMDEAPDSDGCAP